MKIQTKIFNYGHENESSWPPKYGTGEHGVFHISKESGTCERGYPKRNNLNFGSSAYVIQDTIDKYYHPGGRIWVDSRKDLETVDKVTGCITSDKMIESDSQARRQREEDYNNDRKQAVLRAIEEDRAGTIKPVKQVERPKVIQDAIDRAVHSLDSEKLETGKVYKDIVPDRKLRVKNIRDYES